MNSHLQGFQILNMKLTRFAWYEHKLYIKKHSSRKPDPAKPKDRTLYVLDIPLWFYEEDELVKKYFQAGGEVESVRFEKAIRGPGFKNAYIVFASAESLVKVLELDMLQPIDTPADPLLFLGQKWNQGFSERHLLTCTVSSLIEYYSTTNTMNENQEQNEIKEEEGQNGCIIVTRSRSNSMQVGVVTRHQAKAEKQKKVCSFCMNLYRRRVPKVESFRNDRKRARKIKASKVRKSKGK